MVFKFLIDGNSGDLNNAADFGGYYNDTVYAGYQTIAHSYTIQTHRGDDLIDLRDLNIGSFAVILAGAGNDTLYGHAGFNSYKDQSGNDNVNLGAGGDSALLGKGNDKIDGGTGIDAIDLTGVYSDVGVYTPNATGAKLDLQKTTAQDLGIFGKDIIKNFENIGGSQGSDTFYGTSGANFISGNNGTDFIDGRGGNDQLTGGEGKDTFVGGLGGDALNLSEVTPVRDHVRYHKINESSATSVTLGSADWINGFDKGGLATDDKIDLSRIDARASTTTVNDTFIFRGVNGAFSSSKGEIRIFEAGGNSYVYIDNDADLSLEMIIVVQGVTGLTAVDFIL